MSIQSRVPREEYDAIEAINITRLKYLLRSPQHYQHALEHPKASGVMTVGIATHVSVLEPERFLKEFAIWNRKTDTGRSAPRNGKWWEAFQLEHQGQTILTEDQGVLALEIAKAVRFDEVANKYLATGDPEASLEWEIVGGRPAKGRVDWLTSIEGQPTIVGLKTSRDCRHFQFGSQAAKLGYHLQWAWYHDGFEAITGKKPHMVEVVVESDAPHAVATYIIPEDILAQGREEYQRLLQILASCEASGEWPGPVPHEEYLTLPTWAYPNTEDDLADLELEPIL
jgi:exodeoxyribonuclease VIII